jgi:general secretion pathway protein H
MMPVCRERSKAAASEGSRAGFTLIETIVVLVILGLALTIVAGFIPRRNGTLELANATSRVVGAMRLARSRAMVESRPVPFAVTADGHGYIIDDGLVTLGPSVRMVMAGPRVISFSPDGSASGGSLRVLVGEKFRVVQVDWLTGRVTIVGAS